MTTTSKPTTTLPIISLSDWKSSKNNVSDDETAQRDQAMRVCRVCHETGFFLLQDHGLEAFLDDLFRVTRHLFALPTSTKEAYMDKRKSPHFRGWEAVGSEYTNNRPDMREQVDLWTEHESVADLAQANPKYLRLLGPNQWLPDDILPGYRQLLTKWFTQAEEVADQILEMLALGLDLDQSYFRQNVFRKQQRMSLTKLIRYPPTPVGHAGVNAHHDTGFLTLLACETSPGLQVQQEDGSWLDVTPPTRHTLVVNLGEMLQAMTGNYYVATPHRVIVSQTQQERYSIGYFHGPALDTPLTTVPLQERHRQAVQNSPRHATAGFMASRAETAAGVADMQSAYRAQTYGEQLWNYFRRSYPENCKSFYPEDDDDDGAA